MSQTMPRLTTLAILAASVLAIAGCQQPGDAAKEQGDASSAASARDAKDAKDPNAIPGFRNEKERISYMIGLDIAETLKPVKDEVDIAMLQKALRTSLEGGKPLMDEAQATQVREEFAQKIRARQIAERMAEAGKNAKAGQAFLAENAKKPGVQTTASGLQYEVLTAGKGAKPGPDDVVRVQYEGRLLDGTKFDSSYDKGEPALIPLSQVVPGWREGIQLMPVGSKYRMWLPAALAYGETGTPGGPIPPNATLVFEVELLDIAKNPRK